MNSDVSLSLSLSSLESLVYLEYTRKKPSKVIYVSESESSESSSDDEYLQAPQPAPCRRQQSAQQITLNEEPYDPYGGLRFV